MGKPTAIKKETSRCQKSSLSGGKFRYRVDHVDTLRDVLNPVNQLWLRERIKAAAGHRYQALAINIDNPVGEPGVFPSTSLID